MFDQAVLDDFNRADASPIPTNPWYRTNNGNPRIVSNRWATYTTLGFFTENRYEGVGPFTDCEAYATVAVALEWHVIAARLQSVTNPGGTVSGYYAQWASSQYYLVRKNGASAQTILGGPWSIALASGDKMGIRCIGTTIQGWYNKTGTWVMAGSATDATYASGYLGLAASTSPSDNTGRMDNFGGGAPVTAPTFVPQIIVS